VFEVRRTARDSRCIACQVNHGGFCRRRSRSKRLRTRIISVEWNQDKVKNTSRLNAAWLYFPLRSTQLNSTQLNSNSNSTAQHTPTQTSCSRHRLGGDTGGSLLVRDTRCPVTCLLVETSSSSSILLVVLSRYRLSGLSGKYC
jgi:hypothetical protein